MKNIFLLCFIAIYSLSVFAQNNELIQLSANSLGKIYIQEKVVLDSVETNDLLTKVQQYHLDLIPAINKKGKKSKKALQAAAIQEGEDSLTTWVSMVNYFTLYEGLIKRRVYGEVSYTTTMTIHENGYTYSFSDFYFQEYKRNRYGQFVKSRQKKKALEKIDRSGLQQKKMWQNHDKKIQEHIRQQIEAWKLAMR